MVVGSWKELHCVFVDLEKAYGAKRGGVTVVRFAVGVTDGFKAEVGLHQGLALSPF